MTIIVKIWHFFLEIFQALVIGGSIFLICYAFIVRIYEVNGQSMFPTFKDQEKVFTDLITPKFTTFKRGDVVVFEAPLDHEKHFIKRVIGLPGETVRLSESNFYINGNKLDESSYLDPSVYTGPQAFLDEEEIVTVPSDSVFVTGDNRPHSSDSRDFGFVKINKIDGKSWLVFWPFTQIRFVTNPLNK